MFKSVDEKDEYFSTKVELKINGIVFRPSICYKVPALAKGSLEKYAAEGKVVFYPAKVRFVNGAVATNPVKQQGVASISEPVKVTKKRGK